MYELFGYIKAFFILFIVVSILIFVAIGVAVVVKKNKIKEEKQQEQINLYNYVNGLKSRYANCSTEELLAIAYFLDSIVTFMNVCPSGEVAGLMDSMINNSDFDFQIVYNKKVANIALRQIMNLSERDLKFPEEDEKYIINLLKADRIEINDIPYQRYYADFSRYVTMEEVRNECFSGVDKTREVYYKSRGR